MNHHPIELEIRGEIAHRKLETVAKRLKEHGFRLKNSTRRTSVMSFGNIDGIGREGKSTGKGQVDVRCRITNGKAEVVAKIGETHASNRVEISKPVSLKDMLIFARMFGAMNFFTKVGSKKTQNFVKGNVVISLVESPSKLAYIEIEKMTDREHEAEDQKELETLAKELNINLWKTRQQFLDFCDQLTKRDDWEFHGSEEDIERLKKEIKKTRSALATP